MPAGTHRTDLVSHLERLPILCQQLNFTLKSPTVGKSATFNKVDTVIQQTKDLMNCVAKVVTTCFICATKVRLLVCLFAHPCFVDTQVEKIQCCEITQFSCSHSLVVPINLHFCCFPMQYNIDYRGTTGHKWRPVTSLGAVGDPR